MGKAVAVMIGETGRMYRRLGVLLLALSATVTMLACAGAGAGASGRRPTVAETGWTTDAAEVTGVRRGPRPETVLVDVSLPSGHDGCARNPRTEMYTEENGTIFANVVFDLVRGLPTGSCRVRVPAVVTLTAPQPIGERTLVLNQQAFGLMNGGYVRCAKHIGCHPPANHCDIAWQLAAVDGLDAPAHSRRKPEYCDQNWLIMTLDFNSAACGAGGRGGCSAPPLVTRYFMRFDNGWRVFAATRRAGCDDALIGDPDFPRRLCENLPATR